MPRDTFRAIGETDVNCIRNSCPKCWGGILADLTRDDDGGCRWSLALIRVRTPLGRTPSERNEETGGNSTQNRPRLPEASDRSSTNDSLDCFVKSSGGSHATSIHDQRDEPRRQTRTRRTIRPGQVRPTARRVRRRPCRTERPASVNEAVNDSRERQYMRRTRR